MPSLNTRVWVAEKIVRYEHYQKPMANPLIILKISAKPDKVRRYVLSQEVVIIRRHIQPELPCVVTMKHVSNLSKRVAFSGYSDENGFRKSNQV